MRLLGTGSRGWSDLDVIYESFGNIYETAGRQVTLVHGDAAGADRIMARVAKQLGWQVEAHPAIWRPNGIYNPQAGLLRNRRMVELGADCCLAFILNGSSGASHCARLAEEAGIPTRRYTA